MVKNAFKKTLIWLGSTCNEYRQLQLKYAVEDRIYKKKFNGLTDDIKGYHIHIWSSSNSSMEKSYWGYAVLLVETFTGPEYLQAPSSPREPTRRVLYSINVPARKHGARRAYDGCQL